MSTVALNAEELGIVLKQLTSRLRGRVVGPQDPEWNDARRAWNLAVEQRPAAVAMPESVEDVVAVVEVAREGVCAWRRREPGTAPLHGVHSSEACLLTCRA